MSTTALVQRTKSLLYGQGLGEKPVIVRAAADADESISGSVITFDLLAGEGAASGVAAGDILSVYDAASEATAFCLYVLSVSTDQITALDGYLGATASAADELDGAFFELNPTHPEFTIWTQIDAIIAGFLWPEVYAYNTYNITPDLTDYQAELNAGVEEIIHAVQVIGNTTYGVAHELHTNVDTDVASTGVYAELYAIDSSTVYITVKERITSSTSNEAIIQCIATGAAALAQGASLGGASHEASKKDSQERRQLNPRRDLWQDFLALRLSIANDLSMEEDWFEAVK